MAWGVLAQAFHGLGRFVGGGNATHWPFGGDMIRYVADNGAVFLPAVVPPPPGSAKSAPCTLSPGKIRVYSPHADGGDETWALPKSWVGKAVAVRCIGGGGAAPPKVTVQGRALTVHSMPSQTPVILTIEGA